MMLNWTIFEHNIPVQWVPFPLNPDIQAQVNEPIELVQVAFSWHPPFPVLHSLTSVKE